MSSSVALPQRRWQILVLRTMKWPSANATHYLLLSFQSPCLNAYHVGLREVWPGKMWCWHPEGISHPCVPTLGQPEGVTGNICLAEMSQGGGHICHTEYPSVGKRLFSEFVCLRIFYNSMLSVVDLLKVTKKAVFFPTKKPSFELRSA